MVRLGDCFPYIKNGYNVRQGKDKGGMPITRIETLSDNRFNRDKVGYADIFSTEGLENRILEDGDILMSHINSLPYLGRSVMYRARPGEVFIHGMNLLRLKADRSVVEPEYAELYFRSPSFKQHVLKIAKKAVNQASFSVGNLKELEFPLMSLCDQRDVIERLSSIAAQIKHCQRAIGKLDSLVKSRFVEMFEKCDVRVPLGKVCRFKSGKTLPKDKEMPSGDFLYAKVGDLNLPGNEMTIRFSRTYVDAATAKNCLVPKGSVVFPKRGGAIGTNKKRITSEDCCLDLNLMSVIPGGKICTEYLLAWIEQMDLTDIANGSTVPQINNKDLDPLIIPLPKMELQQEFAVFTRKVDKSRFVAQQQIEKLQMLYDSLAQEYFGD